MATCRGIDLSVYQGAQDWKARKAEGIVFGFAKASEGQHTHDTHFATHITGIKAAGLVPGAYHFAWPNQDVNAEAANYIAAVKAYAGPGFVHWLDLERRTDGANYAGRTAAQIKAWAAAWIAAVSKAFPGQRVGVYTSGSDLSAGHVPAGTPLWYPAYPGTSVDTYAEAEAHVKPRPSKWSPLLWQFTSRDPSGASLDRSICYLSAAELRVWANPQENIVTATDDNVKALRDNLLVITSLTEKDAKGALVKHGAGYFLAHIHALLVAAQANEAAQSAAIATLVKTVATLASNTAAIDPAKLVAEIQAAIDSVTVHITTS